MDKTFTRDILPEGGHNQFLRFGKFSGICGLFRQALGLMHMEGFRRSR